MIPTPAPEALPEMSRHEASWHEHIAGLRAAEKARNQGADPEATAALATATAGPRRIGGFEILPASQGVLWTLQRIAREWNAYAERHAVPGSGDPQNPGTREMIELGLATLAFIDARDTWRILDCSGIEPLILRAEDMIWRVCVETQIELQAYFTSEMDRLARLSNHAGEDAPKKPQPAAALPIGASPEIPTPQADPASPPANGSPPNMA